MEREHRYSMDDDRCTCGGQVVYFEDPDADARTGEGCEVAGLTWQSIQLGRLPPMLDEESSDSGRADTGE
jgi:hypothetical protein